MKKVLKISALLLGVIFLGLLGFGIYFKTQIKPILIGELNTQLDVKVDVSDIGISGFKKFPNLGIKFSDVVIEESQEHYKTDLLKADELYLYVDLKKLWNKEYVIDEVEIKNGEIHLADLKSGSNYEIFKSDTSNSEAVSFEIDKMRFVNVKVDYQHLPSQFVSSGTFKNMKTSLKYSEEKTALKLDGDLFVDLIEQSGEVYLKEKDTKLLTAIDLEEEYTKITIQPSELAVADVELSTSGVIFNKDIVELDIAFANKEAPLKSILTIIPASLQESFSHLDLAGKAELEGYFKGAIDDHHNPSFGFTYDIKDAKVNIKDQNMAINNVNASGELSIPNMGSMKTAWVKCKLGSASSGSTKLNGNIYVKNFDLPYIQWDGLASMDARTALALIDYKDLKISSGHLLVDGKLSVQIDPNKGEALPNSLKYVGKVTAKNVKGKAYNPDLDLKDFDCEISADNRQMVIKSCQLNYNNTKASLIGYIQNSDDMFSHNSSTEIVGELKVAGLNINELYGSSEDSTAEISSQLFPYRLKLRTQFTDFKYNDFTAQRLSGTLKSNKRSFEMPDCEITALEGESTASIKFLTIGENYLLDVNSKLNGINVKELFKQFNNFEQSEITDQHISGKLSGKIMAKVILDRNYEPVMDKLYAKADVEVVNGELNGYEPLQELSAFVEVDDLKNVRFNSLKNTIEIFDETIYIPKMFIGNNALSLELEGTHNFDNYMEYRMSISLVELLAGRSNWIAKKKEKRIEENRDGGLTAYITMVGTPDDLKISYDKAAAREIIAEEVKKEKKTFIKVLKGETVIDEDEDDITNYNDIWDE
ncbi:AsmA family protein [bacterium]|nr:AsmA family protein [bacterium]